MKTVVFHLQAKTCEKDISKLKEEILSYNIRIEEKELSEVKEEKDSILAITDQFSDVAYAKEHNLLMMCLYVLMASVVAVYAPELFATKVRFRCVGFANAVAKLLNVLMPMVVGWMLTSLGTTSIFVAISAIAIASMLIVGFFGAETAQKSVG